MDSPLLIGILVAAVVAVVLAYTVGRSSGGQPYRDALGSLRRRIADGQAGPVSGAPEEVSAVAAALEDGWGVKGAGDADAHWSALRRFVRHLEVSVERPLLAAADGDATSLRSGVHEALGRWKTWTSFCPISRTGRTPSI